MPRRFFWLLITSRCCGLSSGTTIGTSDVHLWALLLETTGVSVLAYSSSILLISSLDISTALKTKSTSEATLFTSLTSFTIMSFTVSGIGDAIFQRPPIASSYLFPALRGLAAIATTSNQGCFSNNEINLCPTIPVPPRIPALNFLSMFSSIVLSHRMYGFILFLNSTLNYLISQTDLYFFPVLLLLSCSAVQYHLIQSILCKCPAYRCLEIKYSISYVALAIPKFYHRQHACAWMGYAMVHKALKTRLKHQRPHNSCLLVKYLELARVI